MYVYIRCTALVMESRMERTTSMPSIRDVGKSTALSYKTSFAGLNFWDKARGESSVMCMCPAL